MPTITITDQDGTALVSAPLAGGGLGRYVKAAAQLRASWKLARALGKPLSETGAQERTYELDLTHDVALGESSLTIDASSRGAVEIHQPGTDLFEADELRQSLSVPEGTAFVSLSLSARLGASLAGERRALSFGFAAGTGVGYSYCHPIDLAAAPRLGDSLKETLGAAIIPGDAADLAAMTEGAIAVMSGEASLEVSGEVGVSASTVLFATPGLPIVGGLDVIQGATASIGATWAASGAMDLRVTKTGPAQARLAYHRRRASSLDVSARASLGIGVELGNGRDPLALLLGLISRDPQADLAVLGRAGLDDDQIEAIQSAIAASVDRSLSLSAELELSSRRQGDALFSYAIDLDALDDEGRGAVEEALHGRLSGLERLASANAAIRHESSAFARLRQRRSGWRINLFGALNVARVTDLVRLGTMSFDPVGGALSAADRITSTRLLVRTRPFETSTEQLRRVTFESLMVTAAYQCSRVLGTVDLSAAHTYVEQHNPTRRADVASHYDAIVAMDLTDGEDRAGRLGSTLDFGPSTFMLECTLNRDACDQLFLDGDGKPLREDHYERIARDAFLALIPRDAPDRAFRRVPLERQSLWVRMRALGPASLSRALPPDLAADRLRVEVVVADYTTIVWWAQAMARAAAALVEARQFLANRGPAGPGDSAFAKVRERLEESLARVVVTTEARWGDPWDVLALDAASNRRATVRAVIVSPALSMAYDERRAAARGTLPKRRSKITERGSPRRRRRPSHAERRAGPRVGTRRRTRGGRGRKR